MKNGKKVVKIDFINKRIVFFVNKRLYDSYCESKRYYTASMERDAVTTTVFDKDGAIEEILIAISGEHLNVYENKAMIVHELSHAVTSIFENYGFDCDELRSYILQYLYIEIMKYYDLYLAEQYADN